MTSSVAIVPARGGSKGVPRKNLCDVAGKPLIGWTCEAALACLLLERVIVSTDSPEIAEVALGYGVEIPFMRPAELALDDTPGIEPILHAVRWLDENQDYRPDQVVVLQPTSPLRLAEDVSNSIRLAIEKRAEAVVSVTRAKDHPYWTKIVDAGGRMSDFLEFHHPVFRRQDLPDVYALNGAVYVAQRKVLLERRTLFPENTYAYVMPQDRSLDVDTLWDLHLADLILKAKQNCEVD
jgi:CMP-N,N'-diacetyllegionaminic acid synthase